MLGLLAMLGACAPLPDVQYETDRLQIAPEFDTPICEGTLWMLDEHLEQVEAGLGRFGQQDPYRLYWMRNGIEDICGPGRGGCFFPATRMMFARGYSITHEMTHAALDSEGESFFLEEGMAELLSGVGGYYDPRSDDGSVVDRLRLSRSSYRAGGIDYAAAAHFMHWIYDHRGRAGVQRMALEVEEGASPKRLEAALEEVMQMSSETIEQRYRRESDRAYEGLMFDQIARVPVEAHDYDDTIEGPERYTFTVTADLDCGSIDTMGPLPDEREGMYRIVRVHVPENAWVGLQVDGDPGTWVEVFDPHAARRRGAPTDWMFPRAEVDPDALRMLPGEIETATLHEGVWAVMLGSDRSDAPGRVTLSAMVAAPDPTPERPPGSDAFAP